MLDATCPESSVPGAAPRRQRNIKIRKRTPRIVLASSRMLGERLSIAAAAAVFALPAAEISRTTRATARAARARQAGIFCFRHVFSASFSRAGRVFGRDRTTARHACEVTLARLSVGGAESALPRLGPALANWVARFAEAAAPQQAE